MTVGHRKVLFLIIGLAWLINSAIAPSFAQQSQPQIAAGTSNFQFTDSETHKSIRVWCFRPDTSTAASTVVFVIHGVNRDAERYCREWAPYAREHNFLLICPEFDAAGFSNAAFQRGNLFDGNDRPLPESEWTFSIIERLFDFVRVTAKNTSQTYYIYGHSAGGQFVHRFVLFMPHARYARAIAANPGWYTMPDYAGRPFPYGLRGTTLSQQSLKESFGRDFVLLLGDDDTNAEDSELRKTKAAEEQGATRFDRGQHFFTAVQSEAKSIGAQLNWRLQTVSGAHHSDRQLADTAATIMFSK